MEDRPSRTRKRPTGAVADGTQSVKKVVFLGGFSPPPCPPPPGAGGENGGPAGRGIKKHQMIKMRFFDKLRPTDAYGRWDVRILERLPPYGSRSKSWQ